MKSELRACLFYLKIPFLYFAFAFSPFVSAQWVQVGTDIDAESAGDMCGQSVSMPNSKIIAVGAINNDANGSSSGHVRVYEWSGAAWIQKGSDIDGEAAIDLSGFAVSMPDGNTVAIGAHKNSGNGTYAGHVRIYEWSGTIWTQKGSDIDGEAPGDSSGISISMPNANVIAIGASRNDGNGTDAGHVRIYEWSGTIWNQKGLDIDGEHSHSGSGVNVSMPDENTVAIGAYKNDGNGKESGHVRIYIWSGSNWIQKGADIDGEMAGDWFGSAVSMPDANTVGVGAPRNDGIGNDAGHVRIYEWSGSAWTQKGSDIDGESSTDWSGTDVSMPDANTIAISAIRNYGSPGAASGHVRVYEWSGAAWVQVGSDIDGESFHDYSGISISMPDAITVAIGAPRNEDDAGHARIFKNSAFSSMKSTRIESISFYPNPADEQLIFESNNIKNLMLSIVDLTGCVVLTKQISSKREIINLSDLNYGIYYLKYHNITEMLIISR